jgi:hypothetical protein
MDTIHIIIAGCSFSDIGCSKLILPNTDTRDGTYSVDSLSDPVNTLKYINYLSCELNYTNNNFIIHSIGKGSSGNHIIYHLYKNKVNELINSGINPKNIYSTIQLTAIARPTHCIVDGHINIENYQYDYINKFEQLGIDSYKILIEKHIENIENIINFNLNNKIYNYKIFFGWATYFKEELIQMGLYDKLIKLKELNLVPFNYSDKQDILNKNCAIRLKLINLFKNEKEIEVVKGDEFGGMAEICREYTNLDEYFYASYTDSHLNGFGNYIFYTNFYRNFFIEWKLIDIENKIEKDTPFWNKIKTYFLVQQQAFKESKNNEIHESEKNKNEFIDNIKSTLFKEIIENEKRIQLEIDKINEQEYIENYIQNEKQSNQ